MDYQTVRHSLGFLALIFLINVQLGRSDSNNLRAVCATSNCGYTEEMTGHFACKTTEDSPPHTESMADCSGKSSGETVGCSLRGERDFVWDTACGESQVNDQSLTPQCCEKK